jgi:hypothetical protein
MVSQELLSELRVIIKEDYSVELSDDELSDVATTLVGYYDLLAKLDQSKQKEDENDGSTESYRPAK